MHCGWGKQSKKAIKSKSTTNGMTAEEEPCHQIEFAFGVRVRCQVVIKIKGEEPHILLIR